MEEESSIELIFDFVDKDVVSFDIFKDGFIVLKKSPRNEFYFVITGNKKFFSKSKFVISHSKPMDRIKAKKVYDDCRGKIVNRFLSQSGDRVVIGGVLGYV